MFALRAIVLLLAFACLGVAATAAEYIVSLQGDDAHDGLSRESSFRTIQRGVDALAPGDTLTILPGEYAESVRREGLGNADSETRIRADIPGTVILRGDVAAPAFEQLEGFRFIYRAAFDQRPITVLERTTLQPMEERRNITDLEFRPGSFFYDETAGMLYIATSDLQPPAVHRLTISLRNKSGLYLDKAQRVTIEGLVATGYYPTEDMAHTFFRHVSGIMVNDSTACSIIRCVAFFNGNGITAVGGSQILIDSCTAYGNGTRRHAPASNIARFNANDDIIRNSLSYASTENSTGCKYYAGATGPMLFEGNIAFDNPGGDYWIKTTDRLKYGKAVRNVGLGGWNVGVVEHNLVGGRNSYNADMSADNVRLPGLDQDREFADPLNVDFRLQSTSTLRGSGPEGADRGPYPYEPVVYFVSADGDDARDGRSLATAWRTAGHALAHVKGGDTLYFTAGRFTLPEESLRLVGEANNPISIRGRGHDVVQLVGDLSLTDSAEVVLDRLHFTGSVEVADSRAIAFRHVSFHREGEALQAREVDGLRVEHCLFSAGTLVLDQVTGVVLTANVYDNDGRPAVALRGETVVRYSDYNSYADPQGAWQIGGAVLPLTSLPAGHGRYSFAGQPSYAAGEVSVLVQGPELVASALGKPLGPHALRPERQPRVAGFSVFSVTDTTANLEWWTSEMLSSELSWRYAAGEEQSHALKFNGFGGWSLTGLQPGTDYTVRLEAAGEQHDLTFRTAVQAHEPVVYHVSPQGNDANSGRSLEEAWRTLNHAAAQVKPGDTVLLDEGTYTETVWMRSTGVAERPVTWRAAPGKKVVFDGAERVLVNAVVAMGKQHLAFDGFYIQGFGMDAAVRGKGQFNLYQCEDIRISRCFMDGRGGGYNGVFVFALETAELSLENCVIIRAFSALHLLRCPDLRITHTVFLYNQIAALIGVNRSDEPIWFEHNIVTDSLPIKVTIQLFEVPQVDSFNQANNCYFLRLPPEERQNVVWFYQSAGKLTLPEMFEHVGRNGSVTGDPGFRGAADWEVEQGAFLMDTFINKQPLDFPDLFATREELVANEIGLQPQAFADFHFNQAE